MAEKMDVGCARPTGGPVGEIAAEETKNEIPTTRKEVSAMIHVGQKAPDFGRHE